MPILVPNPSRRVFLSTLAFGAAAFSTPGLFAEESCDLETAKKNVERMQQMLRESL